MSTDLQEWSVVVTNHLHHRRMKLHWISDISPPIISVQIGAGHRRAGHGGEQGRRGWLGIKAAQTIHEFLSQGFHHRAVIRHVHLEKAAENTLFIEDCLDFFEGIDVTRERYRSEAVNGCHRDEKFLSSQQVRGTSVAESHGEHRPFTCYALLQAAAMKNDSDGVF